MIKIGFSDLTEDESLLIALFREWQSPGQTYTSAEQDIAQRLKHHSLYPLLNSIFLLFARFGSKDQYSLELGDVLTEREEQLLDQVSYLYRHWVTTKKSNQTDHELISLRQVSVIKGNNRDWLLERIHLSYWQVANLSVPSR